MKKIVVSSSFVLAFSLYILTVTPGPSVDVVPPAIVKNTQASSTNIALLPSPITSPEARTPVAPVKTPAPKTKPVSNPAPTPTPAPTPAPAPAPVSKPKGAYNDGTYTGNLADAYYGIVQVQAVIQNGKLADVRFLSYPSDRSTSRAINSQAMPILISEAIRAQNANVDIVSGASDTSAAFQESLANALTQAKA
jgi:uncharacterized protein with FMN-binding domain